MPASLPVVYPCQNQWGTRRRWSWSWDQWSTRRHQLPAASQPGWAPAGLTCLVSSHCGGGWLRSSAGCFWHAQRTQHVWADLAFIAIITITTHSFVQCYFSPEAHSSPKTKQKTNTKQGKSTVIKKRLHTEWYSSKTIRHAYIRHIVHYQLLKIASKCQTISYIYINVIIC